MKYRTSHFYQVCCILIGQVQLEHIMRYVNLKGGSWILNEDKLFWNIFDAFDVKLLVSGVIDLEHLMVVDVGFDDVNDLEHLMDDDEE